MEYFANLIFTKDFLSRLKKKKGREMEKNLRLLLRLSSSFTTLNCKVDEYSLKEIKMKRQIGPVTCAVMDNWTSSPEGGEKKKDF